MISAVAEMYEIHPQTLRLYEREGLLRPSRSEGNTRLYTDEDLERLEFILNLARDLGVNIAGIAIVLQMRERMEEMNRQMQGFVDYVRTEMLSRMQQAQTHAAGAGAAAAAGDCVSGEAGGQEEVGSPHERGGTRFVLGGGGGNGHVDDLFADGDGGSGSVWGAQATRGCCTARLSAAGERVEATAWD